MASAGVPSITFSSISLSNSNPSIFLRRYYHFHFQHFAKRANFSALCATHVAAEGFPMNDFFANDDETTKGLGEKKWDAAQYEALLKGGEQVTSVLEEMVKLVSLDCFISFKIFLLFSSLFFWVFRRCIIWLPMRLIFFLKLLFDVLLSYSVF